MTKPLATLAILASLLAVVLVVSLGIGAVSIAPGRILQILTASSNVSISAAENSIVWDLRLPRVILACCVGAGLGMSAVVIERVEPPAGPLQDGRHQFLDGG